MKPFLLISILLRGMSMFSQEQKDTTVQKRNDWFIGTAVSATYSYPSADGTPGMRDTDFNPAFDSGIFLFSEYRRRWKWTSLGIKSGVSYDHLKYYYLSYHWRSFSEYSLVNLPLSISYGYEKKLSFSLTTGIQLSYLLNKEGWENYSTSLLVFLKYGLSIGSNINSRIKMYLEINALNSMVPLRYEFHDAVTGGVTRSSNYLLYRCVQLGIAYKL